MKKGSNTLVKRWRWIVLGWESRHSVIKGSQERPFAQANVDKSQDDSTVGDQFLSKPQLYSIFFV